MLIPGIANERTRLMRNSLLKQPINKRLLIPQKLPGEWTMVPCLRPSIELFISLSSKKVFSKLISNRSSAPTRRKFNWMATPNTRAFNSGHLMKWPRKQVKKLITFDRSRVLTGKEKQKTGPRTKI